MKILKTIALTVLMAVAVPAFAAGADLNGKHYQGIAKIKGQPVDCWVNMIFDDTDIEFNIAETFRFGAGYTATAVGDKVTVKATVPGSGATTFTSADGGSTFEGKVSLNGQSLDLWVLEVPATLTPSTKSTADLEAVVGAADGYTAFVLVGLPNGQQMCATSEFAFKAADKSFSMTCDAPSLQSIFGSMHGSYSVDGLALKMTDSTGKTVSGTIYDDGYYIKVPMGSASGVTLSLVLIK